MSLKYGLLVLVCVSLQGFARDFYVPPIGRDTIPGTLSQPFASLEKATTSSTAFIGKEAVNIWLLEGTHYVSKTLVLDSRFSASKGLTIQGLGKNVWV
jgi:hypothetical protein